MAQTPLACIVLAAGRGSRMKSSLPKVLHPLAGRPLLGWLLATAEKLEPEKIVVVTAPSDDNVRAVAAPHLTAIQDPPLGTGDAVKAGLKALGDFKGIVMVLCGDGPLYTEKTLKRLVHVVKGQGENGMAFLAMQPEDPTGYGRMLTDANGYLARIVEEKEATDAERTISLCWTGILAARTDRFGDWLAQIDNKNAKGEYYLTDLAAIANKDNCPVLIAESPIEETLGANNKADLAQLERKIQERLREHAMGEGVTLIDPETVYFSWDTKIGQDVTIEPNVFFGPGVTIEDGVTVKAFCHLEGANVHSGAVIGPFARLRPGADIGPKSRIGNFVEVKNATLGAGVKANHHGYIGDAEIGAGTNFSCGAITVNYDGTRKHKTIIGENAMIGSNVSLVAPITVGDGAYIGAGSTVSKDVPADTLAVARTKPTLLEGWPSKQKK